MVDTNNSNTPYWTSETNFSQPNKPLVINNESLAIPSQDNFRPASISSRIMAYIYDVFGAFGFVATAAVILMIVLFSTELAESSDIVLSVIFSMSSLLGLSIYFYLSLKQIRLTGQTLGKKACKIKILDLDTMQPVTIRKYIISRILTPILLSIVPIGRLINIIVFLFDERHQALHDKINNTLVVKV